MAESIVQKGGGGAASDECTAVKTQVLAGCTAVTKDSGDEPAAGTMANRGAVSQALNCGGSYTVPEGYHNGGGKITANSLASQTGGATAEDKYVLNGKTYWKDGVKRTGSMTVASVASFSVAPYSTSQVLATWKNPGRGPYSGVLICAKAGGYPNNAWDGITYQGVGNNSAVNGTSSQIIGGLTAGTIYYFRIWVYCTCSAGDQYSGHLQATCAPTAHGRAAFTASGTWTVPANVRSINVHCTGGGGASGVVNTKDKYAGGGGGGGGIVYKTDISVVPGQVITCTIGAGSEIGGYDSTPGVNGGVSSAVLNGTILVSAKGGRSGYASITGYVPGGNGGRGYTPGKNGENGGAGTGEFGTGTFYGGGGGGGGRGGVGSPGIGGAGGGGNGGQSTVQHATHGSFGTGGGGGGRFVNSSTNSEGWEYGHGGSGNVIITW